MTMEMQRDSAYWHPFAAMGKVRHGELVITRGEGCYLHDDAGNRLFDATASLWYANVGHAHPEVIAAMEAQMRVLGSYHTFGEFANPPVLELADRLAERSPMADTRVFFSSGGGDAIDTAAKLAREHFRRAGQPDRLHLISRERGYHGTHGFGTSLAGIPANQIAGPAHPGVSHVAWDDVGALEAEIEAVGSDRVAAFFAEPVIGAGGVYTPPEGYLEGCAAVCARHGVLFVADAVICGFGRLGTWFGIERFGVVPDMITFAKGVTSGHFPVGGLAVAGHVAAPFFDDPAAAPFRHGATYAGHPVGAAAGIANLEVLERDGLLERGQQLEEPLKAVVDSVLGHALVGETRGGVGFMAAVGLDPERLAADPGLAQRLAEAVRAHGVIVRPTLNAVVMSPPLTADAPELELLADALAAGLDDVA